MKECGGYLFDEATKKAYKIQKHGGRYSKAVVALCLLLAVAYTSFCLWMQYRTGTQPEPQLTIAFFAFITAELWQLAGIRKRKCEKGKDEQNE